MLGKSFTNEKQEWPSFIEKVEDFPHLKILHLRGDLDASTMGEMKKFMKKTGKEKTIFNNNIILDMRKVGHVDTAAIAQFLKILNDLKLKKYRLGIMNAPDSMRHMMGILKLEDVILTFESQKKAFREILAWSKDWS